MGFNRRANQGTARPGCRTTLVRAVVLTASGASVATSAPPTTAPAAGAADAPAEAQSLFRDPTDGAFDVSGFLRTRTGFLPVFMPITEPAVGYGLGGGLAFFHTQPRLVETPRGPRMVPPNATAVGGMGTENGTWAAFLGHLHTWHDGRVRYVVGGGYGSFNLDWFGQGDALDGRALAYNMEGWAVLQKLTFRLGDSDFFAGPTQRFLSTQAEFDLNGPIAGIVPDELDADVSGLGVAFAYDTRNSLFSPTRGTKASVGFTWNDGALGSDFDYGQLDLEACQYVPLGGPFTLGLRAAAGYATEDAPFFDLGSVSLRGIQQGRYVDNAALTVEAELRWDVTRRWTLVGFGGAGWVADEFAALDDAQTRWAGGAGFRYLVARAYDLRMGLDVAAGEDDWAVYVTVGTGWLRD